MKTFFLFFILFLSFQHRLFAQGGHDIGNGGNGVVCYTDESRSKIVSVELMDYWEFQRSRPQPGGLDLGRATMSVASKIILATARLQLYDESLAQEVRTIALSIDQDISRFLVPGVDLPLTTDASPEVKPSSPCFIEQFAVQWRDVRTGHRRFVINKDLYLFHGTSNTTRAGILLHEALYRVALQRGALNSDGVRYFNYLLATTKFEQDNLRSFVQSLQQASLDDRRCLLVENKILGMLTYVRAKTDSVTATCAPIRFTSKRWSYEIRQFTTIEKDILELELDKLFVYKNSAWEQVLPVDQNRSVGYVNMTTRRMPLRLKLRPTYKSEFILNIGPNQIPCSTSKSMNLYGLDSQEAISSCDAGVGASYQTKYGSVLRFKPSSWIQTAPDKSLFRFTLDTPGQFLLAGTNRMVIGAADTFLEMNRDERLTSGNLAQPLQLVFNGLNTYVHRIEGISPAGKPLAKVEHRFPSTIDGHPVLKVPSATGLMKAAPFCKFLGYESSFSQEAFRRIYVSTPQEFFDLVSGRIVRKIDEFVELLPQTVLCIGTFEIF